MQKILDAAEGYTGEVKNQDRQVDWAKVRRVMNDSPMSTLACRQKGASERVVAGEQDSLRKRNPVPI